MKTANNHAALCQARLRRGLASGLPEPQRAMTLVELLVVIAIIGTLIGLLIPGIRAARASGKDVACKNNLRQIGIALEDHVGSQGRYPADGDNGYGVCVFLLPYVEQQALFGRLKPTEMERSANMAKANLGGASLATFLCPTMESRKQTLLGLGRSSYLGTREMFPWKLPQAEIRDSKSDTIAIGETLAEQAWVLPGTAESIPPGNGGTLGSRHSGGANFVFCDASVHFVSDDIDPKTFVELCTIDGGESMVGKVSLTD
jgi:prepilin-type N-terminal cleavage/methylation domain-containing protein/prepilin-type processing-associated H-X9-DG protein